MSLPTSIVVAAAMLCATQLATVLIALAWVAARHHP